MGGLPQRRVAGQAREGCRRHNRAPLYLNPRRGKGLSGEEGKNQKLRYSVITVNSRRQGEREQKDQVSLVSGVQGELDTSMLLVFGVVGS